ncbi:helix-turn-helix domain-containing protein, partial [Dysgonomonas sp. Marseille-P4677]|uniref:helix-turn-helix domain-containing protein n=1 Tax=Dysgonomonas sp. Marseille-P4677 TaxID=2364790 RepID=UPI001F2D5456
ITESDPRVSYFFNSIERVILLVEDLLDRQKPLLNGEHYITDEELSKLLKVHRRTLSDYRKKGILPYIYFGGKVLYKGSTIQNILKELYLPKWR